LVLLCILLSATSCGWHVANHPQANSSRTITIPYVNGDSDGKLTAELVAQVEKEGSFTYLRDGGELTLKVILLDSKSENIGWRYKDKKLANGKKKIDPSEVRRKLLAKVEVIETATNKMLLGPAYILGSTEFDHQYYDVNNNINSFSLGQLTDIDTTYDVVDIPLYRDLAIKIAQYLENNLQ
jgi:hypothetical protein